MSMLEITNLCKSFKRFSLGPIDLTLEPGSVHGLIGANGAGKSTLFRCLMGTVRRNQGLIKLHGQDVDTHSGAWKQSIAYIGDYTPLYEHWSGAKNLKLSSRYYENWSEYDVQSLASRLDLDLDQTVKNYSTGQRSKLAIINALSHGANLLLLDEPTAGLDPVARDTFMEVLFEKIQNEKMTILYATHYVTEIEQLADQLIIIDSGKILEHPSIDDLSQHWRKITFRTDKDIGALPNQISCKQQGQDYEVVSSNHQSCLLYLKSVGAESIQTSLLSINQICVQILKKQWGK